MFTQTRPATRRVFCHRPPSQTTRSTLSLFYRRHNSSLAPEPPSSDDTTESSVQSTAGDSRDARFEAEDAGKEFGQPESYNGFIRTTGDKFRHASSRNWLGGEVPFPMNPSFIPPAPLSDTVRTQIYQEFMQDPVKNSVRALSQKYHISLKRVDAILRLKGMESVWTKGKQLQTGFQEGMEKLLGVKEEERVRNLALKQKKDDWTRYDVHEADMLEQDENRDAARQRYQRLYWESVSESGGEPVVPASLEQAKQRAREFANKALDSNQLLVPRVRDTTYIQTPQGKIQVASKPGRPTIEFRDVGSKFLDPNERLRRVTAAERRAKIRRERRTRKEVTSIN